MKKLKAIKILTIILSIAIFINICIFIVEKSEVEKNGLQKKEINNSNCYATFVASATYSDRDFTFLCNGQAEINVDDGNNVRRVSILNINDITITASGSYTSPFFSDPMASGVTLSINGQKEDETVINGQLNNWNTQDLFQLAEEIHIISTGNLTLGNNVFGEYFGGTAVFEGENITLDRGFLNSFYENNLLFKNKNTTIKSRALEGCNIGELSVLQNCTIEQGGLFRANIGQINISGNDYVLDNDKILFTADKSRLIYCLNSSTLTSYKIPRSVITIDDGAFMYSTFTSLIIPNTVTKIGELALTGINVICKSGTAAENYATENNVPYTLDDTAPTVIFETDGTNKPTKTGSTIVTVSEIESGLYGNVYYAFLNKATGVTEQEIKNAATTLTSGDTVSKTGVTGDYYLYVFAEDYVGNKKISESNVFKIDNTVPIVGIEYSTENPIKGDVTVTLTANEQIQEVSDWDLSVDKLKLTKTYTNNTVEAGEQVTVTDIAGNTKTVTVTVRNIDKVGPTLTVGYSKTTPTKEDVVATITSNEALQAVTGWTLSGDNLKLTKTYTNNTSAQGEMVTASDLLGNESTITVKIGNIDRVAPNVTMKMDEIEDSLYKVTLTINEEVQDIVGWESTNNNKTFTKNYAKEKLIKGEKIIVKDIAGNESEVNVKLMLGDVNQNGKIDIIDILLLQRHISANNNDKVKEKHPEWILDEEEKIMGDVNENGKVDASDILNVKRHISASNNSKVAQLHPDWII